MSSIGLKNVQVQKSFDGTNWTNVGDPFELITPDSSESNIDTSFQVSSGYYYRIVCAHYAKEYGVFGLWQYVPNT